MNDADIQKELGEIFEMRLEKQRVARKIHVSNEVFETMKDRTKLRFSSMSGIEWTMDQSVIHMIHNIYGRDGIEQVVDTYRHPVGWWSTLVHEKGWEKFSEYKWLPRKLREKFEVRFRSEPVILRRFFHCSHLAIPPRAPLEWPIIQREVEAWERTDHTAELYGFTCPRCRDKMEKMASGQLDAIAYPKSEPRGQDG